MRRRNPIPTQAASDTAPETAPDTVPDAAPDAAPETPPDAAADIAPGTAAETAPDAAPETAPETAADTARETAAQTAPDAAADAALETAPGTAIGAPSALASRPFPVRAVRAAAGTALGKASDAAPTVAFGAVSDTGPRAAARSSALQAAPPTAAASGQASAALPSAGSPPSHTPSRSPSHPVARHAALRAGIPAAVLAAFAALPLPVLGEPARVNLLDEVLHNKTAYIPAQCYTRTQDADGRTHNPCATCHVSSRAPHYINDDDLQTAYSFPEPALRNPWTNLFVDRRDAVAAVPDDDIIAYVRQDNYFDARGGNVLAARLAHPPAEWDVGGDGVWSGYVPDVAYAFDAEGFDIGPDRQPTGWRAFAYYPVNGAFWPTNGSTDDVLIRLPAIYRETEGGTPDRTIYKTNLAIAEALIKRESVPIDPTDETAMGVDLDRDGRLGQAIRVAFAWPPGDGPGMAWAGAARLAQERGEAPLAAGLYPLGTELLHTVRYIDVDDATGEIRMSARLKELRYMRKTRWQTYFDRQEGMLAEAKERVDFPDRIAMLFGSSEEGISNGTGWRLQGFIEDAAGDLRPQSFEETVFCVGCHGGIGVNDDDTFAFPRKLPATARAGGWSHWSQAGLYRIAEMIRADGAPEYAHYLAVNGAGDELRGNMEIVRRYLTETGALKPAEVAGFRADVSRLLYPSRERALSLNKAYREIVREQSFAHGRDATIAPQQNVHRQVEQGQPTGITEPVTPWYGR